MSEAERWLGHISAYDKEFAEWQRKTKKIIERYTDKKSATRNISRFNILWSNVQTLVPAVFSRLPKPDVSRRYKDNDPVGRVASMILERCLEYEIEHYPDYRGAMKNCVQDRFLGGRGTTWVRYEPHTGPLDDQQITEDQEVEAGEELKYECAPVDYVHWRDFGHVVARTWEEVPAVWRKVYMGREALVERFGDVGKSIPLDTMPEEIKKSALSDGEGQYEAIIYEIWDKQKGEALWLSKGLKSIIDRKPDPLKLEGFWPCPRPLYATLTTDNLVPTPDLVLYQDLADECDTLATRIDGLIQALKVTGCYNAAEPSLKRLFSEGENLSLIPVQNWAAFSEKQGLKGAIDVVDITPIANALVAAYEALDKVIALIYQITGISDILRGENDSAETATATRTKGQFGTLRLRDMQKAVAEFAAEILRIKAQIICGQFQPTTIAQIAAVEQMAPADMQYVEPAIQLLKAGTVSSFRIEVEADSLVQLDETQEKADRVEFLGAVSTYIEKAAQAAQVVPEMVPLMVGLLKFGVTGFKVGKSIEGEIDQALDRFKQMAANPQPKPDPEMAKVQAQMQLEQQKLAMQSQFQEQQAQRDMALEQWKQQQQHNQLAAQSVMEQQRAEFDARLEAALETQRAQFDAQLAAAQEETKKLVAQMNNAAKIQVAEIQAETARDTAALSAQTAKETAEMKGSEE